MGFFLDKSENMSNKAKKYERIFVQLQELLSKETSFNAQLATINAILYHKFPHFFWVGFYLLSTNRLMVGPYQGPVACQELERDKGVCWSSIKQNQPLIVKNVEEFPNHIACDSRSKSEIVIPLKKADNTIIGVLDIDSDKLEMFDQEDSSGLQKILSLIKPNFIENYTT